MASEKTNDKQSRVSQILGSMFSLRSDMASYEEIENTIVSGSKLYGTNACVLILAILVASIGLNMNSTAVIIGAMLISPLMGGITAIAYGIATNNMVLAKWSAFRLSIQVVISIFTSYVYFLISPITTASPELLARTSPTVWDVLIATCGGFAGIIGQTRKEKSNVIPGVAIATALMPPLCTAGYGLANGNLSYFGGAMYLFFINGFFICLTAILVLKYLRVPQYKELGPKQLRKIHRNIALLAVITMIPSIYLAYNIVAETIENSNAENYIKNEFVFQGTQVVQKTIDIPNKTIEVSLIGIEIDETQKAGLEEKLSDYNLDGYDLLLTQTTVKSGMTSDEVKALLEEYEAADEEPDVDEILAIKQAEELQSENDSLAEELERLKSDNSSLRETIDQAEKNRIDVVQLSSELGAMNPVIKGASVADSDVYVTGDDSSESVTVVTLLTDGKLSDKELGSVKSWLAARLGRSEVVVFVQELGTYREPEDKPGDSSRADESSKADESSRAEKKDS